MASKSSPTSVLPRRSKRSASSSLFVAAAALTSSSSALPIKKPRTSSSKTTKRTQSFTALYPECFPHLDVKPHTLIVGTHPSISSLSQQQYFAHPMNAFWWIAGDCLGFRRDTAVSPSTGKPYALAQHLRYEGPILSYEQQTERFVASGFCLWDVVASCQRPGSLDQDIRNEKPNQLREFCEAHPSIERIVFANGGTCFALFKKHFGDWLASGELIAGSNAESKAVETAINKATKNLDETPSRQITLISAKSVSPAAAKMSYSEKRDSWEEYVYAHRIVLDK